MAAWSAGEYRWQPHDASVGLVLSIPCLLFTNKPNSSIVRATRLRTDQKRFNRKQQNRGNRVMKYRYCQWKRKYDVQYPEAELCHENSTENDLWDEIQTKQ